MDIKVNLITNRQLEILLGWYDLFCNLGDQPTNAEVAEYFGFKSINGVQDHIKALTKKGFFIKDTKKARRRILSDQGKALIAEHRPLSEFNRGVSSDINADTILKDPSSSSWLKSQLLLERDPVDLLNDIDVLKAILEKRLSDAHPSSD